MYAAQVALLVTGGAFSRAIAAVVGGMTLTSWGVAGGASPLLHAITSEILPRKYRSRAQAIVTSSGGLGCLLAHLLGGPLTGLSQSSWIPELLQCMRRPLCFRCHCTSPALQPTTSRAADKTSIRREASCSRLDGLFPGDLGTGPCLSGSVVGSEPLSVDERLRSCSIPCWMRLDFRFGYLLLEAQKGWPITLQSLPRPKLRSCAMLHLLRGGRVHRS